ncbi:MAG TPA: nucleotidyltransferase family protein [Candidatus Binatia bacterium]|jgi:hypothetical protein|nr:nucleotidyltransferase family protein [Candidatus Binatia bacterium]
MHAGLAESSGRLVAVAPAGSWRRSPPACECSAAELEEIAPLLLSSGAAALGWWRIRHTDLRTAPAAEGLHQAYRLNTLQAALQQRTIAQVLTRLRSVEIEPILVKGWAAARLYPELGLRPCGDIDLCVRPEQYAAAEATLMSLPEQRYGVDLHRGFEKFGGGRVDGFYDRSQLVRLGETTVRVLSAEDHLRVLCIHMLREGAWRPVWLCDVAAAVESRPANFAWDSCLTAERRLADWVICAISLAHRLLGADISDTPAAHRITPLPRWLIPTVLQEWASPLPSRAQRHRAPMSSYVRHPAGVWHGLRHRWPNPIEATISMHGRFTEVPRFPFQIGNCLARAAKFIARLPHSLREQW